jgi:hypothetical protein
MGQLKKLPPRASARCVALEPALAVCRGARIRFRGPARTIEHRARRPNPHQRAPETRQRVIDGRPGRQRAPVHALGDRALDCWPKARDVLAFCRYIFHPLRRGFNAGIDLAGRHIDDLAVIGMNDHILIRQMKFAIFLHYFEKSLSRL